MYANANKSMDQMQHGKYAADQQIAMPVLESRLSQLDSALNALGATADLLGQRLARVLVPTPPSPAGDQKLAPVPM